MTAQATDYVTTMDVLTGLCRSLSLLPLVECRQTVERAEALGPIIDSTAYQAGANSLREQQQLLDAAIALQDVVLRIQDRSVPG